MAPAVVAALRARGRDVRTTAEEGLAGAHDGPILARAHALGRVVITHDGDFGGIAVAAGAPYIGIVYLRPGHIRPGFTLESVDAIEALVGDVLPPFIVVARHGPRAVRVRLRGGRGA